MLQLAGAGKRYGQKLLFEDLNWLITPNERTGLVGGNGTGKSTLLKILAGLETVDYGADTRHSCDRYGNADLPTQFTRQIDRWTAHCAGG